MPTQFTKSPTAELDYAFDWTAWLAAGETITAATVSIIPDGLTKRTVAVNGGKVTAWLGGGQYDVEHQVTCHIETSQGRVDDRSIKIRVRTR